jgi:hypothetical protein
MPDKTVLATPVVTPTTTTIRSIRYTVHSLPEIYKEPSVGAWNEDTFRTLPQATEYITGLLADGGYQDISISVTIGYTPLSIIGIHLP